MLYKLTIYQRFDKATVRNKNHATLRLYLIDLHLVAHVSNILLQKRKCIIHLGSLRFPIKIFSNKDNSIITIKLFLFHFVCFYLSFFFHLGTFCTGG